MKKLKIDLEENVGYDSSYAMKIDENGNVVQDYADVKCYLRDDKGRRISNSYECIWDLGDDHFAVCNLVGGVKCCTESTIDKYYDIIRKYYELEPAKLKWGIIRISRSEDGNIIPCSEKLVVPFLYDRISDNNSKTATAMCNGKYTYIDIDKYSIHYRKQLVPCVLDHAVPFDTDYEDFAECSIEEKVGYLPRYTKPCKYISKEDLLTEQQVIGLNNFFKDLCEGELDEETIKLYYNLTGIDLYQLRQHQFLVKKLTRKPNNNNKQD